ncbi:MAG: insulinase family protein [Deltaproteobacteria bacterium]|nr:insulinase family protein [Deltaproteobacteria bacterium]
MTPATHARGTSLKVLLFAGILVLLLSCAIARPCVAYDLAGKVKEFALENGLKVLIVERHTGPTVALYISHPTGAIDDKAGCTGTAHFLEHLRFKGTETIGTRNFDEEKEILQKICKAGDALDHELIKGDEVDKETIRELRKRLESLQTEADKWSIPGEIDRLYTEHGGGALNAFTGQDITTYHVSLPSNKVELWARIESDRLANPVFREFYSERNVIIEERRQRVASDPGGKLREQFLAAAFTAHPYRRPILGWPSDMRYLDFDCMSQFFTTHYTPDNTIITVVGDISPEGVMEIIRRYFGPLPGRPAPLRRVTEEPPQTGERRVTVTFDAAPRLIIGYHKPTLPSFDDCVFDVIDTILSEGRTSRLFKVLVKERGIAADVRTANGYPGARYPNLFVIFAQPVSPHTTEGLESAIYEELDRLKREPVEAKELEKAKNRLKADLLRGMSTNSGLAGMLSYYETVAGDWRYISQFLDLLEKVTPQDVMGAAQKYLTRDNRTVATLVKDE